MLFKTTGFTRDQMSTTITSLNFLLDSGFPRLFGEEDRKVFYGDENFLKH